MGLSLSFHSISKGYCKVGQGFWTPMACLASRGVSVLTYVVIDYRLLSAIPDPGSMQAKPARDLIRSGSVKSRILISPVLSHQHGF